jgi:SAM-dependent methyltransferase
VKYASPVFREIARVLKPGSRLVVGELGKWRTWAVERRIRGLARFEALGMRVPSHSRWPASLARTSGLQPLPVCGAIYYPRAIWAAGLLAPRDPQISSVTNTGASFLTASGCQASKGVQRIQSAATS